MSDPIHISAKYFLHESRTKFYEVVEMWHPDNKRFVVVKRWGKVGAKEGGGEHKLEPFISQRACSAAAEKVISQKEGRGYTRVPLDYGFHSHAPTFLPSTIESGLRSHYKTYDVVDGVMHHLGLTMSAHAEPTMVIMDEMNDIVSEEPVVVPEPIRGEEWGSW